MSKEFLSGRTSVVSRPPEEAEDGADGNTTASPPAEDDHTNIQTLAESSGFNNQAISSGTSVSSGTWWQMPDSLADADSGTSISSEAMEAAARMESVRTTPGAFHVRPLAVVAGEEEAAAARILESEAIPQTELRRSSNALEDSDGNSEEGPSNPPTASDSADDGTDVIDADVEAVAVPIDEAVSTYHAVPVVDALTTSRISEDGEELSSYQLESGSRSTNSSFTPTGGINGTKSESDRTKNKYVIWGLASLLLVAVAVALGLGLGLSSPQNSGNTAGVQGTDKEISYRLMDISPQIEAYSKENPPSASLGLRLPTAVPGIFNRSLFVGWNTNGGIVKVYESKMKTSDAGVSVGPFVESLFIPLTDTREENASEPPGDTGSAIIIDGGADGQSFVVSYRNRVRLYSSLLHEAIRLCCSEEMKGAQLNRFVLDQAAIEEAAKTLVVSDPDSFLSPASMAAVNVSDAVTVSDLAVPNLLTWWNHRGSTLAADADPAIRGFGSSIGYSPIGPKVVVGSDSGHVRIYRFQRPNGTLADWERIDDGLFNSDPDSNIGKAVVAMAGGGVRFAVGYPSLGKVSLYQFIDAAAIVDSGRSNIELVGDIYSEGIDDDDMFGQSLSLDILGNFLVIGAKGYARAYWLRMFPLGYIPAGNKIVGGESDGEEFGSVVASGRVLHHNVCAGCPFILDEQRIAISSPAYDNGRGRVLLYQYSEDEEIWRPFASPIEGEVEGEGMGRDVKISPDMASVVTSSNFGEVRTFRFQPLQREQ